jgi:hypothetical protein
MHIAKIGHAGPVSQGPKKQTAFFTKKKTVVFMTAPVWFGILAT